MKAPIYVIMFIIIIFLFFIVENIKANYSEELINQPNIKSFAIFLSEALLSLAAITVIVKGLLTRSDLLTNNQFVLFMLKSRLVVYFLMICISTIVFFVIGWGIPLNTLLGNQEFLINTIILCFLIFVLYELVLRPIISFRNQ
jgi:hypothetical protein